MSYVTIVTKPCRICGETSMLSVWKQDYERYLNGALIQDAFPDLKASVRETIKTGYHPECWDNYLGPDPDDQ